MREIIDLAPFKVTTLKHITGMSSTPMFKMRNLAFILSSQEIFKIEAFHNYISSYL